MRRLAVLPFVCHLALSGCLFAIGWLHLCPTLVDDRGIINPLGDDTHHYFSLLAGAAPGPTEDPRPFHLRLYAWDLALFAPLVGRNLLAAAPLNALYYTAIVRVVLSLGKQLGGPRTGLLAALLVALWPSLLVHTLLLGKDPLFILAMLALLLVLARWLICLDGLGAGLGKGLLAGLLCATLRLVRWDMWELVLGVVFVGLLLLVLRQILQRRLLPGNTLGALWLCLILVLLPRAAALSPALYLLGLPYAPAQIATPLTRPGQPPTLIDRLSARVASVGVRIRHLRKRSILRSRPSPSRIDTEVSLRSDVDVLRYLPRALVIGLFSPFPPSWFGVGGQLGRWGRVGSGLETLLMYVMQVLALFGLWYARRRLCAWYLLLLSLLGAGALGLVVVNLGALYRMRLVFFILLILLGARGLTGLWGDRGLFRPLAVSSRRARSAPVTPARQRASQ